MSIQMAPMGNGLIFSGNIHDSIPRALFLDKRLTPLERNCWVIMRTMLQADNISAFPSYDELRPHLTMKPFADKASSETVARALIILRLTRWISLIDARRNKNGQRMKNLYVINDSPLSPSEVITIDANYLALVSRAIDHASEAVRLVARHTLNEIIEDSQNSGNRFFSRIQFLIEQLHKNDVRLNTKLSTPESEQGYFNGLRNQKMQSSEAESGLKPAVHQYVRVPKSASSSSNNKIHTTVRNEQLNKLDFPAKFAQIPIKHQHAALDTMRHLPLSLQQQILMEWQERCRSHHIRKPSAYLQGIIQKAMKGEFNTLTDEPMQLGFETEPLSPPPIKPTPPGTCAQAQSGDEENIIRSSPETALEHINKIRAIIKRGTLKLSEDNTALSP